MHYTSEQIVSKIDDSTQIINDLRLSPYLPLSKISNKLKTNQANSKKKMKHTRKTSYGKIETSDSSLTQHHLDIIDAIMQVKEEIRPYHNGSIAIYFDLRTLIKKLISSIGGAQETSIKNNIKHLEDVYISRVDTKSKSHEYRMLSRSGYSQKMELFGIVLTPEYSKYFLSSMTINYESRFREINDIKGEGAGLIKAIIRFFITMQINEKKKIQRRYLDKLLLIIGHKTSDIKQIYRVKAVIKRHKETLKKFSIDYHGKTELFEYTGTHGIRFIPPIKQITVK